MSTSPIDLCEVDVQDGILIQRGLHALGFYDGTFRGKPGPRTKDAYSRYRGADQTEEPVTGEILSYSSKVEDEFEFPGEIKTGARGIKARRVQEWLTFHNFRTAVDDDFGDATKRTVKKFQSARGLDSTGVVDEATWSHLVAPMLRAFARPEMDAPTSLSDAVLRIARQHLREHPVEISGQNKGPWVRAYMNGNEGDAWPWCAGFVTFVMKQAAKVNGIAMPIGGSFLVTYLRPRRKQLVCLCQNVASIIHRQSSLIVGWEVVVSFLFEELRAIGRTLVSPLTMKTAHLIRSRATQTTKGLGKGTKFVAELEGAKRKTSLGCDETLNRRTFFWEYTCGKFDCREKHWD